ncbi:thioesterase family protein [Rhodococcus sp. IEGM 1381]|uniref:thioesterase family protein n=1 Tax=Rhodococcus sp. IEGM 1381 TaxID=3047085 RepID=UPI0024B70AF4|nr:thioesterase family protein [Rhodococcus sp. IEGM 1381]MDI9893184.1 thioesterase family protein [Rhodococcus sp. IEGM 1381]
MSSTEPSDAAYYLPLGVTDGYEHFTPTHSTMSVWTDTMQHGGPPSALLVRALEGLAQAPGMSISRVTVDILGAIGLSQNRTRAIVIRPGRQISQIQAELDVLGPDGRFRTAARATAWLLASTDTAELVTPSEVFEVPTDDMAGGALPDWIAMGWATTGFIASVGFHRADAASSQPNLTWLRSRIDLVEGETASPLSRFACVVDIANGLGSTLSPRQWTWMNTDTTIHLHRAPTGHWFGVDAQLVRGKRGFGYTAADLFDEAGSVGRSSQTVLLTRLTV